jgi:hypothetical protein
VPRRRAARRAGPARAVERVDALVRRAAPSSTVRGWSSARAGWRARPGDDVEHAPAGEPGDGGQPVVRGEVSGGTRPVDHQHVEARARQQHRRRRAGPGRSRSRLHGPLPAGLGRRIGAGTHPCT